MKKKLLATMLALSVITTGGITTAVCIGARDKQPTNTVQTGSSIGQVTDDKSEVMGDGVNAMPTRMTFRNARTITNASEYDSVTIQASIKPDNATNKKCVLVGVVCQSFKCVGEWKDCYGLRYRNAAVYR